MCVNTLSCRQYHSTWIFLKKNKSDNLLRGGAGEEAQYVAPELLPFNIPTPLTEMIYIQI